MKCQLRRVSTGLVLEEDPDWDEKKVEPARHKWLKARRLLREAGLDASKVTLVCSSEANMAEKDKAGEPSTPIRNKWKRATSLVIGAFQKAPTTAQKGELGGMVLRAALENDSMDEHSHSIPGSGFNGALEKPLHKDVRLKLPKIQTASSMASLYARHDGKDISEGEEGTYQAAEKRKASQSSGDSSNSRYACGVAHASARSTTSSRRKLSRNRSVESSSTSYHGEDVPTSAKSSVSSRRSTSRTSSLASSRAGKNLMVAAGAASLCKKTSHDKLSTCGIHTLSMPDHVQVLSSCDISSPLSPHGVRNIIREMNCLSEKSEELFLKAKARFARR
jgi:hypothetical protein